MPKTQNELYVGREHLTVEGGSVKHIALIKEYRMVTGNKVRDDYIPLVGMDIETNHLTGEPKLFGFYQEDKGYAYYTEDFLDVLFMYIRYCKSFNMNIAYWNKLDSFIILKTFLQELPEPLAYNALERYGKEAGEWDGKSGSWRVPPIIELKDGDTYFGIKNAIRSSIQFFYYREGDEKINTIWSYDIAQLYFAGLEKEAMARLPYYSKVDKSAHLVDWERFDSDSDYRNNIVLKSNELDARAVYDLGYSIQDDFNGAFEFYPKTLISHGSFARSAVYSDIYHMLEPLYQDEKELDQHIMRELRSIGIVNYKEEWVKKFGRESYKDMEALFTETYSGGRIEAISYGYAKEGWTADIASAYPGIIQNLYDLRGADIVSGNGKPPDYPHSYTFIRGTVHIPRNVDFHPITVKHWQSKDTNISPVGTYKASYTLREREYLVKRGATFEDEYYYQIRTTGKKSILAKVGKNLVELRKKLKAKGSSSEYMAKIVSNSLYGILFEAVATYIMVGDKTARDGYSAGEFWNPLYASIITSETRILMSEASDGIEKNGGNVILLMTDSILWEGSKDMLPKEFIREEKTLGYFEPPEHVKDIVCLGSGRYSYKTFNIKKDKWTTITKRRGLNVTDIHDEHGVALEEFNWQQALNIMARDKTDKLKVSVRTLISNGIVLHNHSYNINDLGRIVDQTREVEAIVGKNKRFYLEAIVDPSILAERLVRTEPIYLNPYMFGDYQIHDQTLPKLREALLNKKVVTRADKKRKYSRATSKRYYMNNKQIIRNDYNKKYNAMTKLRIPSKDKSRWANLSREALFLKLEEHGYDLEVLKNEL